MKIKNKILSYLEENLTVFSNSNHDRKIDQILGLDAMAIEKNINPLPNSSENSYTENTLLPEALYTSYLDLYNILNYLNPSSGSIFVDLGAGIARMKLLFSILRPDLNVIAIEFIKERISAAIQVSEGLQLPLDHFIEANLFDYPIPLGNYYLIYLPTGPLLDHLMKQLCLIACDQKITLIAIESHGDLITTLKKDNPWLVEKNSSLHTATVRHNEKIYIFEAQDPAKHQLWYQEFKTNMRHYLQVLIQKKVIYWDQEMKPPWQHLFVKKLSSSLDYDFLINDQITNLQNSPNHYKWLASIHHIENGLNEQTYQCHYPPRTIHENNIESIIIPDDFLAKWRQMRFDLDPYKQYGYIRKIIISPQPYLEFSDGTRKHLAKIERGFRNIMKKKTHIQNKFSKQKEYNLRMAQEGCHPLVLILDHLKPDFNIGKIFRSGEIFGVREIHVIGTSFFDPLPSMGSFKKLKAYFYTSFEQSYLKLKDENYQIFCLDSRASHFLHELKLPQKTAFVLGHEEFGPQFKREDFPDIIYSKIKQFGVTESLNVSIAASIATYEYIRQNNL